MMQVLYKWDMDALFEMKLTSTTFECKFQVDVMMLIVVICSSNSLHLFKNNKKINMSFQTFAQSSLVHQELMSSIIKPLTCEQYLFLLHSVV